MEIDLELYRSDIRLPALDGRPPVRLSVIDISPEQPQRTFVFLHGFGGAAMQWRYQLKHFSSSNRVIALDQRGHGRSQQPGGPYTMQQVVADLHSALDVLGVNQKIILVGHSFGGAVAAEFTAAHPDRVQALALIASAGEFKLNPLYRLLLNLPGPGLRLLRPFTRGWLGAAPHVLQKWYLQNLSQWNGWSLFRGLETPTLVIRGHLDLVFERPAFEEVARAIPFAEDVDVGASGHLVMLERREAVNRALTRFVDAGSRSWRENDESQDDQTQAALQRSRPWLLRYDQGVPHTIAIPRIPVQHLLDSSARRFAGRDALRFEGARLSYAGLKDESDRFAAALQHLGVLPGERVMLLLPNLPQLVIAFYGALKAGAVVVFALPTTAPGELIRQLRDSGACLLVTLDQFQEVFERLEQDLRSGPEHPLRAIVLTRAAAYLPWWLRLALRFSAAGRTQALPPALAHIPIYSFRGLLSQAGGEPAEHPAQPGDLAVILYTGGTTDAPKGVMLSHRNLVANALQTRHWIPDAREGRERFLCVLPFAHSYGMTTALNVPVALGATLILKARFEAASVLETIRRERPTIFPGVPQMYVAIKDFPGVRKYKVSSIRACISGASPLPVEVQEAFEKLTRGRLVEGYGLTEAGPVTHANPLNSLRKVGSIGLPLPSTEARLVDLSKPSRPAPAGQIGELAVRGPQVMLGYWNNPAETARVLLPGGWLLTGDVAAADSDGYYRIIARKADMWYPDKPGEPAFPRDVEEVLFEIPQVKEAAVVAIAGQPIAFVIGGRERPTSEALVAYCKRRLPPHLVPRLVVFVDDFPRTFIGKVLRRELAALFEQSHAHRLSSGDS